MGAEDDDDEGHDGMMTAKPRDGDGGFDFDAKFRTPKDREACQSMNERAQRYLYWFSTKGASSKQQALRQKH